MRRLVCAWSGALVVWLGIAAGVARADYWTPERAPAPGATANSLNGVSCVASNACEAVGWGGYGPGLFGGYAARWNGREWTLQSIPQPDGPGTTSPAAVSCTTASACTAVGSRASNAPLVERWNGTSWRPQATPALPGKVALVGVSCPALNQCLAVGSVSTATQSTPVAELWDGARWTVVPPASPGTSYALSAVSCSARNACTAVGTATDPVTGYAMPLAERWNGTSWTVQPVPEPPGGHASLFGVSCPSAQNCVAVGRSSSRDGSRPLAVRWNGAAWSIQPTPTPPPLFPGGGLASELDSVSCPARSFCLAVGARFFGGQAFNLAELWDGVSWRLVPPPYGDYSRGALASVSCPNLATCQAVGSEVFGTGELPLAAGYHHSGGPMSRRHRP